MQKILLMTALLFLTVAVSAQTYNNPRQKSNSSTIKVSRVDKTANYTIVYLKYTQPDNQHAGQIYAYPTLTDESTGKRYKATEAMNFTWGAKYRSCTFQIKFPALPKDTYMVTFKEADGIEGAWIIKNIALTNPSQQNTTQKKVTTTNGSTTRKASTTNNSSNVRKASTTNKNTTTKKASSGNIQTIGGKTTYTNPSQRPEYKYTKVTKIIRSKESTIVHFYVSEDKHDITMAWTELVDDDTNKSYRIRKGLNFLDGQTYYGNYTYKMEFPPLPKDVSVVHLKASPYYVYSIQIPPVREEPKTNTGNKTVIINM